MCQREIGSLIVCVCGSHTWTEPYQNHHSTKTEEQQERGAGFLLPHS